MQKKPKGNIVKKTLFLISSLLLSINAFSAWDETITGKIAQIDVEPLNGNNAGFRIRLEGTPELCGNDHTWAYLNQSDQNYQTAVSIMLAAKMSGKEVTIFTNQNSSWNNYCHIGYVVLR